MYIYFFETLLYLSFALTGGYVLLLFIPDYAKPQIKVHFSLFQYALLGIPIFSFMSILRMSFILRDYAENMSFLEVVLIVLKDYKYGNAWIWNLIICTVMYAITLFCDLQKKRNQWALAFAWLLSILAHGFASHPAAMSDWGFLFQSVHVGAISLWLGTLIIAAWFTKGDWNWKAFVRWFTPMSIGFMILIVAAGVAMMFILVDGYLNSWGINYGQALLLKHLVFIPMLLLAFMNGFMTKLTSQGTKELSLQWWLRAETVIALIILFVTAYMGIQEPPHEGEFDQPAPSLLFRFLHGDYAELSLQWQWNFSSATLFIAGVFALVLIVKSFKQQNRSLFITLVCIAVLFTFIGLLLAVK